MGIMNNISALNAHRMYNKNTTLGAKASEKLASGKRIVNAADDAAGMSIAEKMKSLIRGLEQAAVNTKNASELVKVADGALGEAASALQRMRELSVQASNGTLSGEDIAAINKEFSQLSKEIDSISKNTEYNEKKLIDGSLRDLEPMRPQLISSNTSKLNFDIHDDEPAELKSQAIYDKIEIHNGKPAVTKLYVKDPLSMDTSDTPLTIKFTDKGGVTETVDLHLDAMLPFNANYMDHPLELSDKLNTFIQNDPILKNKITVIGNRDLVNGISISFQSLEKENNLRIELPNSPALNEIKLPISNNPQIQTGRVKNNELTIGYSHKVKGDNEVFDSDTGFSFGGEKWVNSSINITIPFGNYTIDEFISELKKTSVIPDTVLDNEISIKNDSGRLCFSTIDEGKEAKISLSATNNSYLLNDLSIAEYIHQTSISENGKDKTDTFAIEINVKYEEIDVRDEELSENDMSRLDNGGIIYTADGYIIADPYNPQDYIRYRKINGTGEKVIIGLDQGLYDKGEFAKLLEKSVNESIKDPDNKIKVTFDYSGAIKITTEKNLGSVNSVRFVPPDLAKVKDYSPHNTTSEEILHQFLVETGFDSNMHVGKNGTDKLNVQIGANANDTMVVKIGSIRTGALGIKRLKISDNESDSNTIAIIDKAIEKVSKERTNIGAYENRFEHIVNILENSSQNLTASESKISDADMAKEMMKLSVSQILLQSSQSMISKANEEARRIIDILK